MGRKWTLDPGEVEEAARASSSGKTGQLARQLKVTSCLLTLKHRPTGLQVQGEMPPGRYSKQQMVKLRNETRERLFAELEKMVATHLRIPGR